MDKMSNFTPLFQAFKTQPTSLYLQVHRSKSFLLALIKDQLSFSSILAVGGTITYLLYLAIGSKAFLLAPLLLVIRIADAVLQVYGYRKNPYMENVLVGPKQSAQYPSSNGTFTNKPADGEITVFMIGARNNHPLGLLAPGWKEIGDYFDAMVEELEKDSAGEKYGYLGSQGWIENGRRATGNENSAVMYFKNPKGLHDYAHGPLHRKAWDYWNKTEKEHSHFGIWHEVFVSPKGAWETIYINCQPLGLGAASFPIKKESGLVWQSPLVDASRGVLRSSKGRMTMSDGADHEKYADDPYNGRA